MGLRIALLGVQGMAEQAGLACQHQPSTPWTSDSQWLAVEPRLSCQRIQPAAWTSRNMGGGLMWSGRNQVSLYPLTSNICLLLFQKSCCIMLVRPPCAAQQSPWPTMHNILANIQAVRQHFKVLTAAMHLWYSSRFCDTRVKIIRPTKLIN